MIPMVMVIQRTVLADESATRDIGTRDYVITEVMAAIQHVLHSVTSGCSKPHISGSKSTTTLKVESDRDQRLSTNERHPAGSPCRCTYETTVLLDRLSNVVGAAGRFEGLGANGLLTMMADIRQNNELRLFLSETTVAAKTGTLSEAEHWATSTVTILPGHIGTPGAIRNDGLATVCRSDRYRTQPGLTSFNEVW